MDPVAKWIELRRELVEQIGVLTIQERRASLGKTNSVHADPVMKECLLQVVLMMEALDGKARNV